MSYNRTIEEPILRKVCNALIVAGYALTVDYERGYDEEPPVQNSADVDKIVEEAFAVDEFWLMADAKGTGNSEVGYDAFVYFIWANGNQGWDCISDHSGSLSTVLNPVTEWVMEQGS